MNTAEQRRSPVYRQLEAYEETWKRDHKEAMDCRDWEDAIAVGLAMYRLFWERLVAWHDQVFRGTIPFAEEDNSDHQARLANWLATTKEFLVEALPEVEARFGQVQGAAELRQCAIAAEGLLQTWVPPRLSMAVGLRDQTLSPEAAGELDGIIEKAGTNPPPMPTGPIPREISAQEFFALLKRPGLQ